LAWCAVDAAFSAWMFGEDELYNDCLSILERGLTPMTEGSVAHFLDCVRGRGLRSQTRHERLKIRSNGWMIAAANASDDYERLTLARRAVVAADQSAQPYYKIISRLALGMCDKDNAQVHFSDAQHLAATLPSPALQRAVDQICEGSPTGPLASLAQRFKASPQRRVLISVVRGETIEDNKVVPLSPREHELLTFFVVERRPLTRQEIVSALWPDADDDAGRNQLKTLITTLRARFGDKQTVVFTPPFYTLARWFRGDIGDIEAVLRADSADDSSLDILREYYTQLRNRQRLREDRWEWFPPYAYHLEQLEREVGSKCARMYLLRNCGESALDIARMMVTGDPHDMNARALAVQAYAHMGLATQARQEIEEYRRVVRDELGIEDDGGELYALFHGMRINPKKTDASQQSFANDDFLTPPSTISGLG
jgi:DNA-binding SARP family transcriptional activator